MSIGSRTGNRQDDRAALRALYMNILVSTIGLAAYDVQDDGNLDTLDAIIANVYMRTKAPRIDNLKGETGPVEPVEPARLPQTTTLPATTPTEDEVEADVQRQFRTSDPEPA